ncbi:VanZ family protein [Clostridium gasigenes]|uniref:VanZ like family protein n=1 Tax=Clostridium gasigenes TaxID=94869 RepID=A0A1H0W1F1_9CLOT|nr:VanZ family protein [Clostridium gasigenes]MBB6625604.1 VanZ family protein [Clostridium gasigenes]MBU3090337.1 VanZ family protein [Clostridium gasigenes]MBU3134550.1 VanZ family protein [Clostridium gasigenes]SDP84381.1 VanZ like family protein [Clostridium gasigenes]
MIRKNKVISWVMLLVWMGIIFFMSNQTGEVSGNQSDLVIKIFEFLGIRLDSYFGELATFIIRKASHFTEYLILFLLLYRVNCLYMGKRNAKLYTLLGVLLYAGSDEIHQYFIPGRAMAFKDVIIDISGGGMAMILTWIYENVKSNKES